MDRRFWTILLIVVGAAAVLRVGYVAVAKAGPCEVEVAGEGAHTIRSACPVGDEIYYNAAANHLADGGGFTESEIFVVGRESGPAADHPPLTVVFLAGVSWAGDIPPLSWLGDDSHVAQHRYAMAALGSLLVLLIGVAGREGARALRVRSPERVGWAAAAIAAVYPGLWAADGVIFSETVANLFVVAATVIAMRLLVVPGTLLAILAGAACGLAALARAELALLLVALAVPVLYAAARKTRRWRDLAACVCAAIVVAAPWVVFNLSRFEEPVLLSTNSGLALAGSNCDRVYHGDGVGLTSLETPCVVDPTPAGETWDQSQIAAAWQEQALEYMGDNAGRVPVVMAARVGRTFSIFRPADMLWFNEGEGRGRTVTMAATASLYPMFVVAIAGLIAAWRRRPIAAWVLCAPLVVVTLASALTYGQMRFRGPAEPSLALLAALGSVLLWECLRSGSPRRRDAKAESHA